MPIIAYFSGSVQSYLALGRWRPPPLEVCPYCHLPSRFIGHGSYPRYVAEAEPYLQIRIPRLLCLSCRHTFGVVPSFLIPGRHYSVSLIQAVLALYYQVGLSRRKLAQHYQGVPALSTCLAWIRGFATRADLWLQAVLKALARFDSGYDPLEVLIPPLGKAPRAPRLLLDLLPPMMAALGLAGQGLRPGLVQGLGLLALWGQNRGLPGFL
jgi:hypothetical protein